MTELPPISLEGYALTHEDVERMKNDAEKELQETRKELGFIDDEICINNSTSSMLCAKISELVFELETQRKEYYDKRTVLLGQLERLQKAISNEQFSW